MEGMLETFNKEVYALHNLPNPSQVSDHPGQLWQRSICSAVDIKGEGGHGAHPQRHPRPTGGFVDCTGDGHHCQPPAGDLVVSVTMIQCGNGR
jgi:metal-dependent amidase/aminoacylase/carboxypeptidase family protein